VPTQVRTLRNQRIAYSGLAAGSDHSVALTVDGGVFSWGSSRCGQLGHGSTNKETLPRRVMELMGTVVSQVAAGDRHTLALVPSRNKLYAFGVAGSGQLGRGPASLENSTLPQMVQGGESFAAASVRLISAGGNTSWAVTATSKFRESEKMIKTAAISLLTPAMLEKVESVKEEELMDQDLLQELETIFSSLACLNGSLLNADHWGCRGSNPGVDLNAWRAAFTAIAKCAHDSVPSLVLSGLLTAMEQLRVSPPDVEALRFYLVLPLHPALREPANAKEFHIPFAQHLLRLQGPALKVNGRDE
jgi:E3 ubiquitin-protein ligase HERC4